MHFHSVSCGFSKFGRSEPEDFNLKSHSDPRSTSNRSENRDSLLSSSFMSYLVRSFYHMFSLHQGSNESKAGEMSSSSGCVVQTSSWKLQDMTSTPIEILLTLFYLMLRHTKTSFRNPSASKPRLDLSLSIDVSSLTLSMPSWQWVAKGQLHKVLIL